MTTLLFVLFWAASVRDAALVLRTLHLPQVKPQDSDNPASGSSKATSGGEVEAVVNCVHRDRVDAPATRDAPERTVCTTWAEDLLKSGSGIERLQADSLGTELALLPTATAAEK